MSDEKVTNKEMVGYFVISLKTNNLLENKDLVELILGKKEKVKTIDNTGVESFGIVYKITILRANKCVDLGHYSTLLKENDFNESDFKSITASDLKDLLLEKNKNISKILHKNCSKIVEYIKEIRGI